MLTPPLLAEERTLTDIARQETFNRGFGQSNIEVARALNQLSGIPTQLFSAVLSGNVVNLPESLQRYYNDTFATVVSEL